VRSTGENNISGHFIARNRQMKHIEISAFIDNLIIRLKKFSFLFAFLKNALLLTAIVFTQCQ